MKLKSILLTVLLAIVLNGPANAGPYDDWPDDDVCMWLDMKPTHEGYLGEAQKRSLNCEGGKAVAGSAKTTTTSSSGQPHANVYSAGGMPSSGVPSGLPQSGTLKHLS